MNKAWGIVHTFTAVFAAVVAMGAIGIVIQEEQRKQRAREAELDARFRQRESLLYGRDK